MKDLGEQSVSPKFCNKSFIKFFKDVLPALPVIASTFADVYSLFLEANSLRNLTSFLTLRVLFLNFLIIFEEIICFAPFLIAWDIKFFHHYFFL